MTFNQGDVFASIGNGLVNELSNTGTLVQTLNNGKGAGDFTTGSAFDSAANFYVTDFGANAVSKFNNNGVLQGNFGGGYATDEDILIDSAGNVFVSNLSGPGLQKFNSAGTQTAQFTTGHRIDWFDLNSSENTMYYTDESGSIHRWDLTTNTAGTDLCASCGNFALRLLGDGTLLVAAGSEVNRVNISTGAIVQTYLTGHTTALFALNLDPDGKTFWTGEIGGANTIFRVNISTGAVVTSFSAGVGSIGQELAGLSVLGEITQVGGVPEPASVALFGTVLGLVGFSLRRKLARK